jgi:iron complex transport system substrate-binding protein
MNFNSQICAPRRLLRLWLKARRGSRARKFDFHGSNRIVVGAGLVLLLASIAAGAQPQTKPPRSTPDAVAQTAIAVKDEMGREVRVPSEVHRIVSLAPNLTETVFALGKGDSLYGDTDFCDFPPEATRKQHVGGPVNPNLEQIAALRPDLILATKLINLRETVDALARLNFPVYVTDPHTVDQMVSSTERLGAILHAEAVAAPLVESLRARLADLDRRLAGTTPRRVLFVVWTDPLVSAGSDTFLNDALRRAGAKSVVQTAAEWPRISLESVAALQPEYLVFAYAHADEAQHDIDALRGKPGWRDLDAMKRGNIVVISDAINRPAPRMVDAIEQLARALHPDAFAASAAPRIASPNAAVLSTTEACACVH